MHTFYRFKIPKFNKNKTFLNRGFYLKIYGNLVGFLLISDVGADCSYVIARPAIAALPGHFNHMGI